MPRLYLDTNVIMDFLLDRYDPSSELLEAAVFCKHSVVISELTVDELSAQGLSQEVENIIGWLRDLEKIDIHRFDDTERASARRIASTGATHEADALHQVAARAQQVDSLVTRNLKDFRNCPDIDVRRPDDI